GLPLAGASALSHDLYVGVIKRGTSNEKDEVKVAKIATIGLGVAAMLLGLLFKGQNVAFMVGLAFAVAASANFPALVMSITWKKFSTKGAVASIWTGLILATSLIIISPTVWVDVIHVKEKTAVEKQIADAETASKAKVEELEKAAAAPNAVADEKAALAAKKKELSTQMPQALFPLKNRGLISMGAA
ncbi:MAG: hypothetical protein HQK97_12315, partial [Nitrospirae bacterium]|nr:hypothetical protein [Nitrospirota bacterium]